MSSSITNGIFGGNIALTKAGLSAGTTTTYSTANTLQFCVNGKFATPKTAVTNGATPTVDVNTNAAFKPLNVDTVLGNACIFVFAYNISGTLGVAQGPIVKNADLAGGLAACQFPGVPDGYTPFGYLLAQAGTTLAAPWTFGSSNLSGVTGMTYTFYDVALLPPQPVFS